MEQFTVEQFQEQFDELIERVDNGESFIITSDSGSVLMVPYDPCQNRDDLIECLCNHNDGC